MKDLSAVGREDLIRLIQTQQNELARRQEENLKLKGDVRNAQANVRDARSSADRACKALRDTYVAVREEKERIAIQCTELQKELKNTVENLKKTIDQRNAAFNDESEARLKWQGYEQNYVLPTFIWAKQIGYDLQAAVRDNAGKNCVELLVRYLIEGRKDLITVKQAANALRLRASYLSNIATSTNRNIEGIASLEIRNAAVWLESESGRDALDIAIKE